MKVLKCIVYTKSIGKENIHLHKVRVTFYTLYLFYLISLIYILNCNIKLLRLLLIE